LFKPGDTESATKQLPSEDLVARLGEVSLDGANLNLGVLGGDLLGNLLQLGLGAAGHRDEQDEAHPQLAHLTRTTLTPLEASRLA